MCLAQIMCLSVATTVFQNGKEMEEAGEQNCGSYRSTGKLRCRDKSGTFVSEKSCKQLSLENISSLSRKRQRVV